VHEDQKVRRQIREDDLLQIQDKEKQLFHDSQLRDDPFVPSDSDEDQFDGAAMDKVAKFGFSQQRIAPAPHHGSSFHNTVLSSHFISSNSPSQVSHIPPSPYVSNAMQTLHNHDALKEKRVSAESRIEEDRERRQREQSHREMERELLREQKKYEMEDQKQQRGHDTSRRPHSVVSLHVNDPREDTMIPRSPAEEEALFQRSGPGYASPAQSMFSAPQPFEEDSTHFSLNNVNLSEDATHPLALPTGISSLVAQPLPKEERQRLAQERIKRKKENRLKERLGTYISNAE